MFIHKETFLINSTLYKIPASLVEHGYLPLDNVFICSFVRFLRGDSFFPLIFLSSSNDTNINGFSRFQQYSKWFIKDITY